MHLKSTSRTVLVLAGFRETASVEAALQPRWELRRVARTEEVLWRLRSSACAALLLGLRLPQESPLAALEAVLAAHPETPVVVLVEPGAEDDAARALAHGAAACVSTGPSLAVLLEPVLERALATARQHRVQSRALELEYREQVRTLALAIRHEINNPLTGVLGTAELALKTPNLPPALHRRLSSIVKLTEEIRSLLQELEDVPERPSRLWQPAETS